MIIDNLFHGTDKEFSSFKDDFLGTGAGEGYIKAHWFIKGDDLTKAERGAQLYAQNFGFDKNHYIYKIRLDIDDSSVVSTHDVLFKKINEKQKNLLTNSHVNGMTTVEDFITSNNNAYELLVKMNIIVITGWTPDNGMCDEYISVLTANSFSCSINIIKKIKKIGLSI